MSIWSTVSAADNAVALLERDVAANRVAHAYLFAGAGGRLPVDVALAFGAAMICDRAGCGDCEACHRVLNRAHPDVDLIEPAGMQLLVEQVRDAIRAASRRPVAGPRRVIIVAGSERMNPNAQNAFLKMLEEPPASTTIVLIAGAPEALLETVRSRCREVPFRQPAPREVAALLEAEGIDAEQARFWARIGGDIGRATTLARDSAAQQMRADIVKKALEPLPDPGAALQAAEWLVGNTRALKDRVAAAHRAGREADKQWVQETKTVADQRLRREQRRAEQDALEASVDDIASVLRDLLVLSHDPDAEVLNGDIRDDLVARAKGLRSGAGTRIIGCLGEIERSRRRLRGNANVLLTVEEMFLSVYAAVGG